MTLFVTGATGYLGSELLRRSDAPNVRVDIRDERAVRAAPGCAAPA